MSSVWFSNDAIATAAPVLLPACKSRADMGGAPECLGCTADATAICRIGSESLSDLHAVCAAQAALWKEEGETGHSNGIIVWKSSETHTRHIEYHLSGLHKGRPTIGYLVRLIVLSLHVTSHVPGTRRGVRTPLDLHITAYDH